MVLRAQRARESAPLPDEANIPARTAEYPCTGTGAAVYFGSRDWQWEYACVVEEEGPVCREDGRGGLFGEECAVGEGVAEV